VTVIDASVLLRRLRVRAPEGTEILGRGDLAAPALIVAETTNGLAKDVRLAGLQPADAELLLREGLALPIELVPDQALAVDALRLAGELSLSSYDALYVALAERLGEPLMTADRRLAERYPRSELIP
jgi:predicted nucleic acid-binding protein